MKTDLDGPVTTREFRAATSALDTRLDGHDQRFEKIDQRLDVFAKTFVTKDVFFAEIKRLESIMYTKADHARDMVWMDAAMEEIREMREERILASKQVLRMDDSVFDHEKRIRVLEKTVKAA